MAHAFKMGDSLRRNPFTCSHSNVALLHRWPWDRPKHQRPVPFPLRSHEPLLDLLCPLRTRLTSGEMGRLRWRDVKGVSNA